MPENSAAAPGRLITVTGIDGAGKSTLSAALHQGLNTAGEPTILVGKTTTDIPRDPTLSAYVESLNALVYRRDPEVARQCGDRYWLLALAAWYTLQDELIVQPALREGTHVVLDNAHHKFLARYAANPAVPTEVAEQVFAHLTPPDLVLFLRIGAAQTLDRKGTFTSLEAGHSGTDQADFVHYQDTVLKHLREQENQCGWVPLDVTGKDRATVLEEAAHALHQHMHLTLA